MLKANLSSLIPRRRRAPILGACLAAFACLCTCDLFKVGLGNKVDIDAPVVAFTSHSQNANVNEADFALSGTVSDDTLIASLLISWPGGSLPATVSGGSWSAVLGPVVEDGRQVFTATVTDKAGKIGVANLALNIDRKAPSVLVSSPQAYGAGRPSQTSYIDIKGEVYDASSIARVEVELLSPEGAVIKTKTADGTTSWSVRFLLGEGAADELRLADGSAYRYNVRAFDVAGNASGYYYHAQDIYEAIAEDEPFPAMSDIGKVDQAGSGTVGAIEALTYAYLAGRRRGTAAAGYGDFVYDSAGDKPSIHLTNLDPGFPVERNILSINAPVTGYVATGPQGLPVSASSISATIRSYPSSGEPTPIPSRWIATTAISGSVSFSIDLRTAAADGAAWLANGRYSIEVSARSAGQQSPESSALAVSFVIDSSAPRFEEVYPAVAEPSFIKLESLAFGSAPAIRSGIRVRVKLADDNPGAVLSSVQAWTGAEPSLSPIDPASIEYAAIPAAAGDARSGEGWFGIDVETPIGASDITLSLQARDATSRTASVGPHYIVDSEVPELVFSLPASGAWLSGTATTLSGTAGDNDQVVKVAYWAGKSGTFPGTEPSAWAAADGTSSWTALMNFSEGQGAYQIRVAAFDRAGNASPVAVRDVWNDEALPLLTESSIGADPSAASASGTRIASFALAGTASDTNALAAADPLTISIDGGSAFPVAVGAGGAWSFAYAVDGATHANDGVRVFVLTATDIAGKKTQISRTVAIDTQAPAVEFLDPKPCLATAGRPDAPTVNGNVRLQGSATDNSTIVKLERKLGSEPWASFATELYGFVLDIPTAPLADKADFVVQIRATDSAGNVSIASKTMYVDQSSDEPAISFVGVSTANPAAGNLFLDNARLQGLATDDDGAVASVEVSIDGGGYAGVSSPPAAPSISFEHSLESVAPGQHFLSLRAADANGKTKTSGRLDFWIDRDRPIVSIGSPASGGYRSASFTMSGGASDANGLKAADLDGNPSTADVAYVEVYTSGPGWERVAAPGGSWTYSVPGSFISAGGDGQRTVRVRAFDAFDRESASPAELSFNVDRTPPTLSVATDLAGWQRSRNVSLSGGAADDGAGASRVARVEYRINSSTGSEAWTALTGTTDWSGVLVFPNGAANKLEIRSADNAGNVSAVAAYEGATAVKVDDSDPTLGFAAPYAAATRADTNAPITFTGTIGDNLSLAAATPLTVALSRDGVYQSTAAPAPSAGLWSYTFPVDAAGSSDDGTWELTFTAWDASGRSASHTRTITVETKPPVVSFNNVAPYEGVDADGDGNYSDPGDVAPAYNGVVAFRASIADDNAIAELYSSWTATAAEPASWTAYGGANRNSWSSTVDTAAVLADGAVNYLWIRAVDRFGNATVARDMIRVDQATDRPALGFSNLTLGAASLANNLGAASPYLLRGTASDDDGIDKDQIYISTAWDANGNGILDGAEAWGAFVPVSGPPGASAKYASFTHSLAGLARERYYLVRLRVGDINNAIDLAVESPASATSWAQPEAERFVLDTEAPDLAISQAKDQFRRGSFTLSGTAADEFGIAGSGSGAVSVDLNGDGDFLDAGETLPLGAAGAWTATVDTAAFGADGNKSFLVSATDGSGRTTASSFAFKLDTTPPSRSVVSPAEQDAAAAAYWHRGVITLGGESSDGSGSGVASVLVAVTALGAAPAAGDWKAASFGSGSWSYTYDCNAAPEGRKTVHVVAADAVGNLLAEAARDFGVDLHDPTLSGLAIDGLAYSGPVYAPAKVIRLTGTAADTREISRIVVEERRPADAAYVTAATITAAAGATSLALDWSRTLGASDDEGTYLYRIVAYDGAGNAHTASAGASMSVLFDRTPPLAPTIASPAEDAYFGESVLQLRGSSPADAGSGLARVEWSPDGSSWYAASGTASFSATLDISASSGVAALQAEGRKTVYLRAVDNAGNYISSLASVASAHFWVDRAAPSASFSAPDANAYVNGAGDLAVAVDAQDANGIREARLRVGDSAFAESDPVAGTVAGNVRSGAIPRASILALADGNHDLYVRVTDNAGRMTVISRPVVVDKTVPLVAFGSQAQGATVNRTIALSGTASDDRSLAGVSLAIYNRTGASWTALPAVSGSTSWSLASFNTESYDTDDYDTDPGAPGYQVKIRATAADAAGNTNIRLGAARPSATSLVDSALIGSSLTGVGRDIVVGGFLRTVTSWTSATGAVGWAGEVPVDETSYSLSVSVLDLTIDQASDIPEVKLSNLVTDAAGSAASAAAETNLIGLAGHGLKAGDAVGFLATAFPGGLEPGSTYYVAAAGLAPDAFGVSATKSGAAIDITSSGADLRVTYGGAYPTTLKMVSTIYGVVTDDDGAPSTFEVSLDRSSWTELALSGGTWSYELATADGAKSLYFRATDARGAAYGDEIRVVRRTAPATSYVAAPVAFRIDRVVPEIGSAVYVDKTPVYDFADQVELRSETGVFGGPTDSFRLMASATDANGIKSVRVDITGRSASAPATSRTVSYAAPYVSGNDYATAAIDLGADFADGAATLVVYVTDNSGLGSSVTRSITIDNTAPTVSFISPANADVVNGEVTVRGLANDGSGSGLLSLSYRLGRNYASKAGQGVADINVPSIAFLSNNGPGGTNNRIDSYASLLAGKVDRAAGEESSLTASALAGSADVAVGNGIKIGGSYRVISAWTPATGRIEWSGGAVAVGAGQDYEVYTDIQTVHDASTGADLFVLPIVLRAEDRAGNVIETAPLSGSAASRPTATSLAHASLANSALVAVGQLAFVGGAARIVTSYAPSTGAIGWSGAVDAAATSFTLYPYCLRIDPNGDKPVASIGYPESNRVYGGKIRVYGAASDDDGVSQVYMQVDCDNDGDFDAADAAGGVDWFNGGLGQLAEGSINWNRTINTAKEFDPAGDTPNLISIRVRARDVYGTYGPWSAARSFSIDKNVPKIGSAYSLKLDPDANPDNGNEIPYEYGMYLTGTWYLRGSIETETALDSVELTGDIARSIAWSGSAYAGDTGSFSLVTAGGGANADKYRRIDLNVRIACPDDTADPLDFELYAEDVREPALSSAQTMRINVDTRAPTAPAGPGYSLANPVRQVDYWAKVSGTANDLGSDVDRVEVFFLRRNAGGAAGLDRFYNLLAGNTYAARDSALFRYSETGSYAYMPRIESAATSRPSATSLVDSAAAGNAMICVGQKILIGGQTLAISAWDRASGTIAWTGGTVDTSVTSYSVDLAIRIDHKDTGVPESHADSAGGPGVNDDDGDGYAEYLKQTSGTTYSWYVDVNSLRIPDGLVEIHYVVYDKAGNRLHNAVSTRVSNNPMSLSSVALGSDLNGDGSYGAASTGETGSFALPGSGTAATGFKVKAAPARIDLSISGGNGQLAYRIMNGATAVQVGALRVSGSLQSVYLSLASLRALGEGTRTLDMQIWDSTEETANSATEASPDPATWTPGSWTSPSVTASFSFAVSVMDSVAPTASIDALANHVSASSHIEVPGVTGGGDPDVSGAVAFTGSAFDDQAVSALWARIGGFAFPHAAAALPSKTFGAGTAVTSLSAGTFAAAGHGLVDGDTVAFTSTSTIANITSGRTYYVVNAAAGSFQVASSPGGAAIAASGGSGIAFNLPYCRVAYYDAAGSAPTGFTKLASGFVVPTGDYPADGWAFAISSSAFSQAGHSVAWRLDWNSARVSYGAMLDRELRIVAEDRGSPGSAARPAATSLVDASLSGRSIPYGTAVLVGSTWTFATAFDGSSVVTLNDAVDTGQTDYWLRNEGAQQGYRVDVVPYIRDVARKLPFTGRLTLAGRSGRYPIYQGSAGVEITGLNLPYADAGTIAGGGFLTINGKNASAGVTAASPGRDSVTITVPYGLSSGGLVLAVLGPGAAVTSLSAGAFTSAAHGLADGELVSFSSGTAITGITNGAPYYVRDAAASTFAVAASPGGPAIAASGGSAIRAIRTVRSINNLNDNGNPINVEGSFSDDRVLDIDAASPTIAISPVGRRYGAGGDDAAKALSALSGADYAAYAVPDAGHAEYAAHSRIDSIAVSSIATDASGLVTTSAAHGLEPGEIVSFGFATAPYRTPSLAVASEDAYYVRSVPTSTTFTASATPGGGLMTFYSAGSAVAILDAEASGQVILHGKAYDDQRIQYIVCAIPGFDGGNGAGNPFAVYSTTTDLSASGSGLPVANWITNQWSAHHWKMEDEGATEVVLDGDARAALGHVLSWKFTWDSAYVSGVAANNVKARFSVVDYYDYEGSAAFASGATTLTDASLVGNGDIAAGQLVLLGAGDFRYLSAFDSATGALTWAGATTAAGASYKVFTHAAQAIQSLDVVPYVKSLERGGTGLATIRSRNGRYPMQVNEALVTIKGYNLRCYTGDNVFVRAGDGTDQAVAAITSPGASADPQSQLVVTLPALANAWSGQLIVRVNGVYSGNHQNDDAQAYNREVDSGGTIAGTLWSDDRYIDLWRVGQRFGNAAAAGDSIDPKQPSMSRNGTSLVGVWSNYANSAAYYATVGAARAEVFSTYDPPEYTDLCYSTEATPRRVAALLRNYYGGNDAQSPSWGDLAVYLNGSAYVMESLGDDFADARNVADGRDEMLYQFQNPRVTANAAYAYVSYYDTFAKCLKYGRVTLADGTRRCTAQDSYSAGRYVVAGQEVLDLVTVPALNVGQYSDIGIDASSSVPVIAYYDTTNARLMVARGQSDNPTSPAQWDKFQATADGSAIGKYVSMKIQGSTLHIAAYQESDGNLVYIRGAWNGSSYAFTASPVAIDSIGSVGQWCDLALDAANRPVVSYIDASNVETYKGLKVAYLRGSATDPEVQANWEYVTVPASSAVSSARTGVEMLGGASPVRGTATVSVGFAGQYFEVVQRYCE